MIQKILTLISIFTISLFSVACSSSKDISYTFSKNQEIKVGQDIPPGVYNAKILDEYNSSLDISPIIHVPVIGSDEILKGYGETLVGELNKEESSMSSFVYNIHLPKGKTVSSNTDVLIYKSN